MKATEGMTLEQAAEILNRRRHDDNDAWRVQGDGLECGNVCECRIAASVAVKIAEELAREKGGAS